MKMIFKDPKHPELTDIWYYHEKEPDCFVCIPISGNYFSATELDYNKPKLDIAPFSLMEKAAKKFPSVSDYFCEQLAKYACYPIYDFQNRLIALQEGSRDRLNSKYWDIIRTILLNNLACVQSNKNFCKIESRPGYYIEQASKVFEAFRVIEQVYIPLSSFRHTKNFELIPLIEEFSLKLDDTFTALIATMTKEEYENITARGR